MDYFYTPPSNITPSSLTIDGDEFSHLVHVMRAKEGDDIRVVDGRGNAYDVRIGEIKKHTAQGTIHRKHERHNEPPFDLTLAVGILKNPSKFDFLVEKTTELGVRTIIPVTTERTIPHHAKSDRWRKLALAAMKQCGRSYLPDVRELCPLHDLVQESASYGVKLIAHEQRIAGTSSPGFTREIRAGSILVLIGPEGGFSDDEVKMAQSMDFVPLYLGVRRLRTETAAVVVSSLLSAQPS